ncbi:MAG: tetratricopeptide repeat protein [Candidatus Magnetomorum sp.]|nr:tetratricopeptide repeat protein [Candidatus Magnetomorum sp.]
MKNLNMFPLNRWFKLFFDPACVCFVCMLMLLSLVSGMSFAQNLDPQKQAILEDYYKQAWQYLSQMHKDLKNLDKAHDLYNKALVLSPDNSTTLWKIAEITFKKAQETKDNTAAKKLFEQALASAELSAQKNPESVEALYWIGTCQAKLADMAGIFKALGLVKSARKTLEKSIAINPTNRFAILSRVILAVIYTESPWPMKDLSEALKLSDQAVQLDPNLTLASVKRAKVLIQKKEKALAVKELQRCIDIKKPSYAWDAELYDWPEAKKLLAEINP